MKSLITTKRRKPKTSFKKKFFTILGKKSNLRVATEDEFEEEDVPNKSMVRILAFFLFLTIFIIGGIGIRVSIAKSNLPMAVEPPSGLVSGEGTGATSANSGMTAVSLLGPKGGQQAEPVTQPMPETALTPLPEPISPQAPVSNPSTVALAPAGTEAAALPEMREGGALLIEEPSLGGADLVAPQPTMKDAPTAKGAPTHLVSSGDTWESIARDYARPVDMLKQANPNTVLRVGIRLNIPSPEGVITQAEVVGDEMSSDKVYVMKKGDNLTKIAKLHKTSVDKLMKLNNFTDKEVRKLQIGQKIMIP